MAKANKWIQTDMNTLVFETGHEYSINVSVQSYIPGILSTGAVLLPPTGASSRVLGIQPGNTELAYTDVASTAAGLDLLYGTGTYTLVFPTLHDGAKALSIVLPADNYPPAPQFVNFDALQFVDVTQPFTIMWDPWVGGSPSDLIVVRIEDHLQNKFFQSPGLGQNGALDGTATSIVIPTNTLPTGQTFEIHVTFIRLRCHHDCRLPGGPVYVRFPNPHEDQHHDPRSAAARPFEFKPRFKPEPISVVRPGPSWFFLPRGRFQQPASVVRLEYQHGVHQSAAMGISDHGPCALFPFNHSALSPRVWSEVARSDLARVLVSPESRPPLALQRLLLPADVVCFVARSNGSASFTQLPGSVLKLGWLHSLLPPRIKPHVPELPG